MVMSKQYDIMTIPDSDDFVLVDIKFNEEKQALEYHLGWFETASVKLSDNEISCYKNNSFNRGYMLDVDKLENAVRPNGKQATEADVGGELDVAMEIFFVTEDKLLFNSFYMTSKTWLVDFSSDENNITLVSDSDIFTKDRRRDVVYCDEENVCLIFDHFDSKVTKVTEEGVRVYKISFSEEEKIEIEKQLRFSVFYNNYDIWSGGLANELLGEDGLVSAKIKE